MDFKAIVEQLKKAFADYLIIQYRGAEKNRKFIKLMVDVVFANVLALQIKQGCLSVENSIGKQLDIVGEWVGVNRFYDNSIIWDKKYFSFVDWKKTPDLTVQAGYSNYINFLALDGATLTWKKLQEIRIASYQLGDDLYRNLIKLKIIKNSIRHTKKDIDNAIYSWSNGQVYTTWTKMGIQYNYRQQYSQIIGLAMLKNCLPVPCGCTITTQLIE